VSSKQAALLLIAISIGVYANTLWNGFVYDDIPEIVEGDAMHMPLSQMIWAPYSTDGCWRPVGLLAHRANIAAFGLNAPSFHAVNIALHAAVVVLLYFLLLEILGRPRIALVAALIFAVHPLHVEAVAPAFSRLELLAALFIFAGWLLHWRGRTLAAAICFWLALASKESAICFLPIILLTDLVYQRQIRKYAYGAYAAATMIFLALRTYAVGVFGIGSVSFVNNPLVALTAPLRMANAIRLFWTMCSLHVWPSPLTFDYSYNAIPVILDWTKLALWIVPAVALVAGWIWLGFRGGRELFLAGTIYLGGLAITANFLFPNAVNFAERWAYFPSAGFCIVAALGFKCLEEKAPRVAVPLLAIAVAAMAAQTFAHNFAWKDAMSLATAAQSVYPSTVRGKALLAWQYVERGDLNRAQRLLNDAERIYPEDLTLQENLGSLAARKRDWTAAERHFRKAVRLSSVTSVENEVVISYAAIQVQAGNDRQALAILNCAMVSWPGMTRAYSNRALLFLRENRSGLARADAIHALELNPNNTQAAAIMRQLDRTGPR